MTMIMTGALAAPTTTAPTATTEAGMATAKAKEAAAHPLRRAVASFFSPRVGQPSVLAQAQVQAKAEAEAEEKEKARQNQAVFRAAAAKAQKDLQPAVAAKSLAEAVKFLEEAQSAPTEKARVEAAIKARECIREVEKMAKFLSDSLRDGVVPLMQGQKDLAKFTCPLNSNRDLMVTLKRPAPKAVVTDKAALQKAYPQCYVEKLDTETLNVVLKANKNDVPGVAMSWANPTLEVRAAPRTQQPQPEPQEEAVLAPAQPTATAPATPVAA